MFSDTSSISEGVIGGGLRSPRRAWLLAALFVVAAIAAGCGGGSEDDVAANEGESTTTTSMVDSEPTTTEETVPDKGDPVDEGVDGTPDQQAELDDVEEIIVPNSDSPAAGIADGETFGPDYDRDRLVAILSASMGPTDDIGAHALNRLLPRSYEVPTLAGTEVISAVYRIIPLPGAPGGENYYQRTEFITEGQREDVGIAYESLFTGLGWETRSEVRTLGEVVSTTIRAEDPERPVEGFAGIEVDIVITDREEGGTIVTFDHSEPLTGRLLLPELRAWEGASPVPEGGAVQDVTFSVQRSTSDDAKHLVRLDTGIKYVAQDAESIAEASRALTDDSDWTLEETFETNSSFTASYRGLEADVFIVDLEPDVSFELNQGIEVLALVPVAAATEGSAGGAAATGSGDGAGTAIALVEPNGQSIELGVDRDTTEAVLVDVLGPTDDLPATLARLGPVPARWSTFPDTVVVDVSANYNRFDLGDVDDQTIVRAELFTSALAEDVVLTAQGELAALGWTVGQSDVNTTGDQVVRSVRMQTPVRRVSITVSAIDLEEEPGSLVRVEIITTDAELAWPADVASGWSGEAPLAVDAKLADTRLAARFFLDKIRVEMTSQYEYENRTEADVLAEVVTAAEASADWAVSPASSDAISMIYAGSDEPQSISESNGTVSQRLDASWQREAN